MAIIYNGVNVAQDPLVSGTNIKTVNGTSLLGSGNIVAGGSSTDYGAIGTYVVAGRNTIVATTANTTVAGSELVRNNNNVYPGTSMNFNLNTLIQWKSNSGTDSCGLSGTWRSLTTCSVGSSSVYAGVTTYNSRPNLYVRVS